jgi:hypothetical protein
MMADGIEIEPCRSNFLQVSVEGYRSFYDSMKCLYMLMGEGVAATMQGMASCST